MSVKGTQINLADTNHNLHKVNQVTISSRSGGYDLYRCAKCGLEAKRRGLTNYVSVTKGTKKTVHDCNNKRSKKPFCPDIVLITQQVDLNGKSIPAGAKLATVQCPEEEAEKYYFSTWVKAPKYGIEVIRLRSSEYEYLTR